MWVRYDSGARGARNVLTWNELGGFGKLVNCEKSRLLRKLPPKMNFLTATVFGFVFALEWVRINRKLHYRAGVIAYNL